MAPPAKCLWHTLAHWQQVRSESRPMRDHHGGAKYARCGLCLPNRNFQYLVLPAKVMASAVSAKRSRCQHTSGSHEGLATLGGVANGCDSKSDCLASVGGAGASNALCRRPATCFALSLLCRNMWSKTAISSGPSLHTESSNWGLLPVTLSAAATSLSACNASAAWACSKSICDLALSGQRCCHNSLPEALLHRLKRLQEASRMLCHHGLLQLLDRLTCVPAAGANLPYGLTKGR